MDLIVSEVVKALAPVVGTLMMGVSSMVLLWLKNYIKAKTNNALVENALTRISNTVETAVAHVGQTVVKGLREAAEDGKLTKEDAIKVKRMAMDMVRLQMPDAIIEHAKLGVESLDMFISTKIEQAVDKRKGSGEKSVQNAVISAITGNKGA
jgi:hypothetical protein